MEQKFLETVENVKDVTHEKMKMERWREIIRGVIGENKYILDEDELK